MFMKSGTFLRGALVVTLSSLLFVQGALAQRGNRDEESAGPSNTIDERTGGILQEAIEFLNNDQFDQARAKLGELNLERLSPYERSRVEQMFFSLDINEENYAGARQHMEAAIASGGMNDQEISTGRYQLAQLYMQEEKWAEGAAAVEEWLKTATEPNGGVYYLLAAAYYNLEDYDKAIPNARKAVDLTPNPQEPWLQMLSALLLQKEDYRAALPVVERQVNMFPTKKTYWIQLSSIYAQLEDYENALFISASLTLGLIISTIAKTQLQAMQMTVFVLLPSILLSGFLFPYEGMPLPARYIAELLPATHFVRMIRGVVLRDASLSNMQIDTLFLLGFTLVGLVIATMKFRKSLD